MSRTPQSVLPEPLHVSLAKLGVSVRKGAVRKSLLEAVVAGLAALPPSAVVRGDAEIAYLAQLYARNDPRRNFILSWLRKATDHDLLVKTPGLEQLFIFHRDGRLREAALKRLKDGLRSTFFFAAIAYRLNDWSPDVRSAAKACAARVFPKTDPEIVATAGLFLLDRQQHWRRWWGEEAAILDDALSRADVTDHLAATLHHARSGPMGALLRRTLRRPEMDRHLFQLSTDAFLPGVRAVALQCLIDGQASWPTGFEQQWIDKSLGKSRRVIVFGRREIVRPCSLETLVAQGAQDRSATVRKIAADGLLRYRSALANRDEIIQQLADDRSPAVRERIDFILRERLRQAADLPLA